MAPPPLLPVAASTPILHGEFGSYPAHGPRFALTLTTQALHIQRLRPKPEARPRDGLVPLDEVSGCGTLQSRSPEDTAAYFCIYTYPRGRRGGRRRATRTFRADGAATYVENRAEAQRWATALMCLLRGVPLSGDQGKMVGQSHVVFPCVPVCCTLCLFGSLRRMRDSRKKPSEFSAVGSIVCPSLDNIASGQQLSKTPRHVAAGR